MCSCSLFCMCVRAHVRVCVRACVRACGYVCVCVCARARWCTCTHTQSSLQMPTTWQTSKLQLFLRKGKNSHSQIKHLCKTADSTHLDQRKPLNVTMVQEHIGEDGSRLALCFDFEHPVHCGLVGGRLGPGVQVVRRGVEVDDDDAQAVQPCCIRHPLPGQCKHSCSYFEHSWLRIQGRSPREGFQQYS